MYTRGPAGGVGGAGVLWSLFVSSKEVWKLVSSGSFLCRCGVAVRGEKRERDEGERRGREDEGEKTERKKEC